MMCMEAERKNGIERRKLYWKWFEGNQIKQNVVNKIHILLDYKSPCSHYYPWFNNNLWSHYFPWFRNSKVVIDVMWGSEKNTEMIELYSIQIDNTISGSYTNFLVGRGTIKELRKTQIYDDKQELIKRKPERGRSR